MPVTTEFNDDVAVVTIDNPPVNALSQAVRQGLMAALAETETSGVRSVVLCCAGRTFVAGADVREMGAPPAAPFLPDLCAALERATRPWVAAIHGSALGGGCELALACAGRIATPDAAVGLPEVTLGLIPGAGGTVRLPRLIPVLVALEMIATGKPVRADRALRIGLVDRIAADDLRAEAVAFARHLAGQPARAALTDRPPRDVPSEDDWGEAERRILARAKGQTAPREAVDALHDALTLPADEALAAERARFLRLKDGPQSTALRHIFFAERSATRMARLKDVPPLPLNQIGVVGGGLMGAGIAAAALLSGLSAVLIERDEPALVAGRERILATLRDSLGRGLISDSQHTEMQAALTGATDFAALSAADLVIEAVFEDMAVKREVFARLDVTTRPDAVLATNTSYLDVGEIAGAVADPGRVLGLHFFSPAHVMKLLEIVHPPQVSDTTLATGFALARRLRKIPVPAGVCDGFIGNRIMSAYRRECDYMLEEGALPAEIDAAMVDFGFPMGIYQMQDMAGLDIAWAMRKRQAATRDPADRYVEIADRLCEAGRFGRKSGRGWYRYVDGNPVDDIDVRRLIESESARKSIPRRVFPAADIMARILDRIQQEGWAVLAEDIADSPEAIDVVMVNGYGFPRWRGGPMFMARG